MSVISIPNIPNLSTIAFYGSKPTELVASIEELQQSILQIVGDRFAPYRLEQIHGTLLGLEGRSDGKGIVNKWFWQYRDEFRYIDFVNFLDYLGDRETLPIEIMLGGYDRSVDYGFLSRDRHPYERSFQIQGNIAVLIGWPYQDNYPSMALNLLRRKAQEFNILHKYFDSIDAVDNDFYLRLGMFRAAITEKEKHQIETDNREILRARSPLHLSIDFDRLVFAYYQDEFLSPETTRIIPLREASSEILARLYSE